MTFISVRVIKTTTGERSCKQTNRQHVIQATMVPSGPYQMLDADGQPQLTMQVRVYEYMKWELSY